MFWQVALKSLGAVRSLLRLEAVYKVPFLPYYPIY